MTKFSVLIPLYNKEKHIKETLNSVLAQTFQDFEIIVVNDGSTDNSLFEVSNIKDERIKLFTIENQGVSHARNYGIEKSNGKLLAFLDADDRWYPNHLEHLNLLNQKFPECGLFAAAYEFEYGNKIIGSEYYNIPIQNQWKGIVDDFFESSKINCIASSSSVAIPKHVFEEIGGFNIAYDSGEDTDLWIRIALKNKIAFSNSISSVIKMDAQNQASKKNINSKKLIDLDAYKEEGTNESLKTYLDLNRFSIALQHKLAGNTHKATELMHKIDKSSLNGKQYFLLNLNNSLLRILLQIKIIMRNSGVYLSSFK